MGSAGEASEVVLEDVLAPGLSIVFCGTAASRASARRRAYYAGPGNRFWVTLHEVGLTPRRLQPEEFRCLPEWGMGLTDLAKQASGTDAELPTGSFDRERLAGVIETFQPRILAFTSKRAAQEFLGRKVSYGPQGDFGAATGVFVLPSPSGAARRSWSIEPWKELAALHVADQ